MATILHPKGNIYDLVLKTTDPIILPFGAEYFSFKVGVVNRSGETWDTSDNLRFVARLIEPSERDREHPPILVDRRASFPDRYVPSMQEVVFDIEMLINLIPQGDYVLMLDLVVEQKYYLSFSGGQRPTFQVHIVDPQRTDVCFHPHLRLPSVAPQRDWLANLRSDTPDNAFRLTIADPSPETPELSETDASHLTTIRRTLAPKKVAVIYTWGTHFFRHYSHFIEFLISLHAICQEHIGDVDDITIIAANQEFSAGGNPDVQRFLLNSLFKTWTVLTHVETALTGFTHVIEFDGHRQSKPMNRLLVDYRDIVEPWIGSFKRKCLGQISSIVTRSDRKLAIYAIRGGSRSITKAVETRLVATFSDFGYEVRFVDFGSLSMQDQIATARAAEIIFGAHGNNLTNSLWLPNGSALVEIFPAGFHSFDFQILCELGGNRYLGMEAKNHGFVLREQTRLPGWTLLPAPYDTHEHHQDDIDHVQLDVLRDFLRHSP